MGQSGTIRLVAFAVPWGVGLGRTYRTWASGEAGAEMWSQESSTHGQEWTLQERRRGLGEDGLRTAEAQDRGLWVSTFKGQVKGWERAKKREGIDQMKKRSQNWEGSKSQGGISRGKEGSPGPRAGEDLIQVRVEKKTLPSGSPRTIRDSCFARISRAGFGVWCSGRRVRVNG